ncbi:MAG: hypothetical protein ABIX01_04205 [Chitinophagaceae bacterium]
MIKKIFTGLMLIILVSAASCKKKKSGVIVPGVVMEQPTQADEDSSMVVVDFSVAQGKMMEIEKYNGSSTSSPIPGEASRTWLKNLNTKLTRVWIQLVFVYNNGAINYNYQYSGSGVGVEDALTFYSTTSDSLLICLSGHRSSGSYLMPTNSTVYKDLVRETILYYKRKFPKIKYIQCSNEPDATPETMATYYPVYQNYYRGLNEANEILRLENISLGKPVDKIWISNGGFTSNVPNMLVYATGFLQAFKSDTDPAKQLNFFSFHSYGEANRPLELLTARDRIDSTMLANGLPVIPIFLSEYGMVGGSSLPSGLTLAQTVTMQPGGQLTKAKYLYDGGISKVLNWLIHHSTLSNKSQLLDVQNAYASPYGNSLLLTKKLSDLNNRVQANSKGVNSVGLGIHTMAAQDGDKGIGVLVWNYNWTSTVADKTINVLVKNLPLQYFASKKTKATIYVIDSKNNNFYINPTQTSLTITSEQSYDYKGFLKVPVLLERSSVVLIMLTPQ